MIIIFFIIHLIHFHHSFYSMQPLKLHSLHPNIDKHDSHFCDIGSNIKYYGQFKIYLIYDNDFFIDSFFYSSATSNSNRPPVPPKLSFV